MKGLSPQMFFWVVISIAMTGLIVTAIIAINEGSNTACEDYSKITGRTVIESKDRCYVQYKGKWIPEHEYSNIFTSKEAFKDE